MKWIRILALLAAGSLVVPSISFAQDGPLGKKGGGKGGGQSGNSGGGKSGGQSGNSGGGKSGGQSGNSGGGSTSPGRSGGDSSGGGGSVGLPGTPPRNNGGGQASSGSGRPITIPRDQYGGQVINKRGNGDSKSGDVHYGSNNNIRVQEGQYTGFGVTTIPRVSTSRGIGLEARGEARHVEIGRDNDNSYRYGYSHYRNDWCDDDFYYPFYAFRWDPWKTVPSPFYCYTHLPAYINCVRISIGSFTWSQCSTSYPYRYRGNDDPYGWSYGRDNRGGDLDYAVDDIYDAFRSGRMRSLGSMIGRSVIVEYGYGERYRMNGDDFYDLMRDVVEGTRTENYLIQDVYRDGDQATVIAYHTFYTPNGIRESVRHVYGLDRVRRGYEITYFRTERF